VTKIHEVYKCEKCGNIVEMLHSGKGQLVCCGEPMELLTENTVDASVEKHVPVITKVEGGFKVTVGSVEHPMVEKHYIEWIQIITEDGKFYRKFLKANDAPEAMFLVDADKITAREYCNLHGLWKADNH
jgi:superoxide reductase